MKSYQWLNKARMKDSTEALIMATQVLSTSTRIWKNTKE